MSERFNPITATAEIGYAVAKLGVICLTVALAAFLDTKYIG